VEGRKNFGSFDSCSICPECIEKHVIPIGFVFVHYLLQHGFEDLVDGLDLTIGMCSMGK
jgi:hypothetical protein